MDDYGNDMEAILNALPTETGNATCRFLLDGMPGVFPEDFLCFIEAV